MKSSDNISAPRLPRRHLIKAAWIRRPLKVLAVIAVVIVLLPVLVYLPPVQTLLKDVACRVVGRTTGMHVSIDRFRLRFPLDVQLDGVRVIEASGDTMVAARSLVADVKLRPLLDMDVQVNRVELHDADYRMLSVDSSMLLKLHAGYLRTEGGSRFNLSDMHLRLRSPELRNATVSVSMNVWKQIKDTAQQPTKFLIEADRLRLHNVTYSMQMLPIISSLSATIGEGEVRDACINLTDSQLRFGRVSVNGGNASYIIPTPEYVETHPAPQDSSSSPSVPMTIEIGRASLKLDSVLYATQGVTPAPGFDASYVKVNGLEVDVDSFYNQASTLRLPITSLKARERSGLEITSASGLLAIDATGLTLSRFSLSTPSSRLKATANLPFSLMAMDKDAPRGAIDASGILAWSDLFAFMPSMRSTVSRILPGVTLTPVKFDLTGSGTTTAVDIDNLRLDMGRFLRLAARGSASHFTDPRRLQARLTFTGSLNDPSATMRVLQRMAGIGKGMNLPSFTIKGDATVRGTDYSADLQLLTSAGNAAAIGRVSLGPERYNVHATLRSLRLGEVMPSIGLGTLTGVIDAEGAGFNPTAPAAVATVNLDMTELSYNGHSLAPLHLSASALRGEYTLDMSAGAPHFNLDLTGIGHLQGATYFADMDADIRYIDLQALGFIDTICRGSGRVSLRGNANPAAMFFDLDMAVDDVDWEYAGEFYALRHAFDASLLADARSTSLCVEGDLLDMSFTSPHPMKALLASVQSAMPAIQAQLSRKQVDFEELQEALPEFCLNVDARGSGVLSELLDGTGYHFDSLAANIGNDSIITGNVRLMGAGNASTTLDTLTLALNQRGKYMDYRAHLGNRADNMPEFAAVTASGYVGGNRASLFVHQQNSKGVTGYRMGLTAAMLDSTLSLHLTPVNAVIAYKDWMVNDDNYIELGPGRRVQALLEASSGASSISLMTPEHDTVPSLDVDVRNLLITDFLPLTAMSVPVSGAINSKMHLVYRGTSVTGRGTIGVNDLKYDSHRVGDVDFNFKAGAGFNGNVGASLSLLLDKKEVLSANGYILTDSTTLARRSAAQPAKLSVKLHEFPVAVANPFLPADMMRLSGHLNGAMNLTGSLAKPLLNGSIACDSVGVYLPMAASWLRLDSHRTIEVVDNVLNFKDFNIHAAGDNPLVLTGSVDASNIADVSFDFALEGTNVALVNNDRRAVSDIYGKLLVNLAAKAQGNMERMKIDGSLSILPATDIVYNLSSASSASLTRQGSTTDVVKFVQFSDSTLVAAADSLKVSTMAMRVTASLNIVKGAMVTVNLSGNGTDKVQLSPYGNLSYLQTYMGDMRLNGTLNLGSGFARYSVKMLGEKLFNLDPDSYVTWTGNIMNPALHINATDHVKANVQQEGANSRLIYFDVGLAVTGTLSAPKVAFDLSTDEDITVQNELQSMTADQRQASAINLLLYNTYTGPGVKATANLGGNPLYSLLEGQLNSIAAKYVTFVDLSFGIDQYDKTVNGETSGTTSYSYQVSKSLFDNRFKIVVGGNYSTDANADENFAESLIADVSFEYALRSTANSSMLLRLFRHTGYENILEGEVTETGVGFVYKRKLANLRSLFRFGRRKHKPDSLPADTPVDSPRWQKVQLPADSTITLNTQMP